MVLTARSTLWDEELLKNKTELDWTDIDPEVARAIVLWLYKVCLLLVLLLLPINKIILLLFSE